MHRIPQRTIVLIGMMGVGKTTIGRRLAQLLGRRFVDADAEIERAAGCSITEIFERHGEAFFRNGERRVITRLMDGPPCVLATGGGAWMNKETRSRIRQRGLSVWLRAPIPVLLKRVHGRHGRPLLATGNPYDILSRLAEERHPLYAEADLIVDCGDETVEQGVDKLHEALAAWQPPEKVHVALNNHAYDVLIGKDLIDRAGRWLAPLLPQKRVVIITDEHVATLHLPRLERALAETNIRFDTLQVPRGEGSKSFSCYSDLMNRVLALGIERHTTIVALGGGVVGDLAGFIAATALRGLPFVQIPTTLLSQVDSSVGGKTGINAPAGKNLIGAFHQPIAVLADSSTLATLPRRERVAGYAEILKAGLIGDPDLFAWCEAHGADVLDGNPQALTEAVRRACAFKAKVVTQDERETASQNGRALLNLGHTFGHALEAEMGYDGRLLHGEAVSIGLQMAMKLSVELGYAKETDLERLDKHLTQLDMPKSIRRLGNHFSATTLIENMMRDKKMKDGKLTFILLRGIGKAFTNRDVELGPVRVLLEDAGCAP
ncbi:shikimate kinase [Neokomagataea thailandica NBRC 106555]|nr:3-dehydroquinate synthase [Neokomagataea thailandica]GBR50006.1 shikimate kinase [Neokomagataea thailandica NBRC 106555]